MSTPKKDLYEQYRDDLVDAAIADAMFREVQTWTGAMAESFWDDDGEDDAPPWAKKGEKK